MNIQIKNRGWKVSVVLGAMFVLAALNILTLITWRGATATDCDVGHNFINPRFECGFKNIIDKREYSELKSQLRTYIEQKENEGTVSDVSIWFRDLEAGPTFGIDEREDFVPASLLKLPLVITFLEMAEDTPALLQQRITYGNIVAGPSQVFAPGDPLQKGMTYTIDELITHTMVYSDNNAAQLLYEYLLRYYPEALSDTYRDLGIIDPGTNLNMASVNTKEYGSIFRMLYNVSFLDVEMSEKLLALLVRSDFKDGIGRGIPGNLVLANKFGERSDLSDNQRQLHDCGIVYYPGNPYQLCVMTRGADFKNLQEIIAEISRMVYEEVDSRRIASSPQNSDFSVRMLKNALSVLGQAFWTPASDISARNLTALNAKNAIFDPKRGNLE